MPGQPFDYFEVVHVYRVMPGSTEASNDRYEARCRARLEAEYPGADVYVYHSHDMGGLTYTTLTRLLGPIDTTGKRRLWGTITT